MQVKVEDHDTDGSSDDGFSYKNVGSSSSKPAPGPVLVKEVTVFCLVFKVDSAYKCCNSPLKAGIVLHVMTILPIESRTTSSCLVGYVRGPFLAYTLLDMRVRYELKEH